MITPRSRSHGLLAADLPQEVLESSSPPSPPSTPRSPAPAVRSPFPSRPTRAAGRPLDVSTGLTYPAKAERARRDPRIALLFSDPVGSGLVDPPTVLVQGLATVRDRDLQAGLDRYVEESRRKLPAASKGTPWFLLERQAGTSPRIWVGMTPLRVTWWPQGRLDAAPQVWTAPAGTGPPPRIPLPRRLPRTTRSGTSGARPRPTGVRPPPAPSGSGRPVLTLAGADGWPLPAGTRRPAERRGRRAGPARRGRRPGALRRPRLSDVPPARRPVPAAGERRPRGRGDHGRRQRHLRGHASARWLEPRRRPVGAHPRVPVGRARAARPAGAGGGAPGPACAGRAPSCLALTAAYSRGAVAAQGSRPRAHLPTEQA